MFAGDLVNTTECRPALHTALRAEAGGTIYVDGSRYYAGYFCRQRKNEGDIWAFTGWFVAGFYRNRLKQWLISVLAVLI